jgi:molybdopterin molybdotransferase
MLTPAEAERLIGQSLSSLPIESLPLAQCTGAILRERIQAERDQPPFDRVAMDGIAFDTRALTGSTRALRIEGMQAAGASPLVLESPSGCIEVMTGAVLPIGCDAVVPVEQITAHAGYVHLAPELHVDPWQNVHRRAADARAGALLLEPGVRLGPPEIAIAASAGMARVRVASQPSILVISTGNELVEPGEAVLPHQIRRSNSYAVVAALKQRGFQRVSDDHVVDDLEELTARLKFHLDTHDVLVLTGGVSMGRLDFVPRALEACEVRTVFHKVAQRPGLPFWFGVARSGAAVFGLPGNPVSTLVCTARYVLPALHAAMGGVPFTERIALAAPATVKQALTFFMPARVQTDAQGHDWAEPRPTHGSGDFTALAGSHGFAELPPGPNTYPRGFVMPLYRW